MHQLFVISGLILLTFVNIGHTAPAASNHRVQYRVMVERSLTRHLRIQALKKMTAGAVAGALAGMSTGDGNNAAIGGMVGAAGGFAFSGSLKIANVGIRDAKIENAEANFSAATNAFQIGQRIKIGKMIDESLGPQRDGSPVYRNYFITITEIDTSKEKQTFYKGRIQSEFGSLNF